MAIIFYLLIVDEQFGGLDQVQFEVIVVVTVAVGSIVVDDDGVTVNW